MAGIAIAQAIEDSMHITISLKWPNDILIDEQKVGGILCESFTRSPGEACVVIGFGINVNLPASAIPDELTQLATSLQIHAQHPLDRHQLLQAIILALEKGCEALNTIGASTCQLAYSNRCSTLGKQILVQFPNGSTLEGMAQNIGQLGQLQVTPSPSPSQEQSAIVDVHAGDIQHIQPVRKYKVKS